MRLFKRSKPDQPQQRHVSSGGRTAAYSYYARRSAEPSALGRQIVADALNVRNAKRAAKYWRQRFGLLLVIIAAVLGAGNVLSLGTDPAILPAETTHVAFLHPLSTYQHAADKLFASSLLNRNKITVDTGAVSAALKRQFPELSLVSITLPLFGHRPQVYIAQADPIILLTAGDGKTYIIDAQGRAVAHGSVARASLQLLPVRDASGARIHLGQLAVPSGTVSFIRAIQFQLAQRQVHIDSFVLPAASSELDIYPRGQKYFVKCNLESNNVLQQAGAFLAVQQYFDGRGITPSQYVDVRVDGRVYYK